MFCTILVVIVGALFPHIQLETSRGEKSETSREVKSKTLRGMKSETSRGVQLATLRGGRD